MQLIRSRQELSNNNKHSTYTEHNSTFMICALWCCDLDKVTRRVHLLYLMNMEWHQVAANSQAQTN